MLSLLASILALLSPAGNPQQAPHEERTAFVLTLNYGQEIRMELARRYHTVPEIIQFCDHLKKTPYDKLMKNWPLVEFWDSTQYQYRARYLVSDKSCLAALARPTELPGRITFVRDSESEARVFVEYFGYKMFEKPKRTHAFYSHVFYLHFSSAQHGIADEVDIMWMGGNPYICFTKNLPFTLKAAPKGIDTELPSEERQGDLDIARCWIDPWVWEQVKNKKASMLDWLKNRSIIWESMTRNWPYLPGKEHRDASVFENNVDIDLTEDGMVLLKARRSRLPPPDIKGINYATLMMDRILYSLQNKIESDPHRKHDKYLMFYRFDDDVFSQEGVQEPAFKPSPRQPKYIRPNIPIELK